MDKQVLVGLLENPQNLTEDHLEELEEIVQKYPYFHVPHVLVARLLQEKNSSLALQKIRKASLYVYNRSLLKKFILNGASTIQPLNAMEEHNSQEPIHKKLFEDIQQEIDAFDKKIENASIEELDKELANITEAYLPKDYIGEEANKLPTEENLADKTEIQKEQDFLIDEFLKSDIFKNDQKTFEENPQEESQDIIEEAKSDNQEPTPEVLEQEEPSNPVQNTVVISEFTEEEALKLFNEGNTKEAIEVYEKLKDIFPDKASYYQSQIDIFKMDFSTIELKEEDTLLQDFLETTPNQEKIEEMKVEDQEVQEIIPDKPAEVIENKEEEVKKEIEELPLKEGKSDGEVTEQQALAYFNEGKITEAVEIYKQLMLQNPDKKAYFASQIEILES